MINIGHKLWDLINPSDRVTFRAVDLQVATFVTVVLSRGQFGATEILPDGSEGFSIPFFMFGGIDEFCQENWGINWEQVEARVIAERADDVAAALHSLIYGDPGDRKLIEELLAALPDDEARKARLEEWNNERRTSLTDINGAAMRLATFMENISKEQEEKRREAS